MRSRFAGVFFYMLHFQEPGLADAELGADPYRTIRVLFSAGSAPAGPEAAFAALADDGRGFLERIPDSGELPSWLTDDEVRVYADAFRSTGYTGPLNWYRNIDRNWELTAHLDGPRVEVPALFLGGGNDPVLAVTSPAVMDGWVTDLRGSIVLDGAGHWLPQERPDDVSAAILAFLGGL